MMAETIADLEENEFFGRSFGNNCATYPMSDVTSGLRDKLASDQIDIISFAKSHPECLEKPYGYTVYTPAGNPRLLKNWRELNILSKYMQELGYIELKSEFNASFPECIREAERLKGRMTPEKRDWALSLAHSSAALFLIHVLNIYIPQSGLFRNMLDANLQKDALGRSNYKPATAAISKAVRKSLDWKGDASGGDQRRAQMIISLIECERSRSGHGPSSKNGLEFENKCLNILIQAGFDAHKTPTKGDFGADLVAQKDDIAFVIQCKDLSKPVGIKAVQEAAGARQHYTADFACVCADSGFTEAALELAASNRVLTTNSINLARSLASAY
ncbi:MAG: restriction endonuclease [Erythrobacter sp.]|jgi:hypothetical protein|nr:restriction endonuclease [Erythrobacter sp.]